MNTVFLGLGGNIGDRMVLLEAAVRAVNLKIGRVLRRSSVYETSPWGSDSEHAYLNMVIQVSTDLPAERVLHACLAIEKNLGRKRGRTRYTDRTMDIDVLFYNSEVISTTELKVPHPRIPLRKFVLIPLAEICPSKVDPQSGLKVSQLLKKCTDTCDVSFFSRLKPRLIMIDGNIGSGKTTLAAHLAKALRGKHLAEPLLNTQLLQHFYEDPKIALSLEFQLMIERFILLSEQHLNSTEIVICDFSFLRSLEFAKTNLKGKSLKVFERQFQLLEDLLPQADLRIDISCSNSQLVKNIAQRARSYEKAIDPSYLKRLDAQRQSLRKNEGAVPVLALKFANYGSKSSSDAVKTIKKYLKDNFGK